MKGVTDMNIKLVRGLAVAAVVLGAGFFGAKMFLDQDSSNKTSSVSQSPVTMNAEEMTQAPESSAAQVQPRVRQAEPGKYVAYSQEAVAADSGRKLLFFHAPWCLQCRQLEADIKEKGVPSGTTIYKVDYDTAAALKKQYGVTLQTTVVKIDNDGKQLGKVVPYSEPTLATVLASL